ncbi:MULTISPECIES: alpha/beta fold hydrolase [unclassified Bacillus (in: firmicutes)]|uniref:alpha/beta fold hydrolase n=1 Tax=unclassified Bacillus (in: firmicutes) TaxID=185979 RepID=UPI0008F413C6|nr:MULTISPECIES: alpha/beta hydrolase [unclassified Bacillus (in: firmicutes)]SFA90652.1 Pimeloyl-ACP methyl ester carboxylesterase [Bacillus sp. UNCCL13]SFQ85331.1 Pimeloyl-ACP methyl ester carboxylesterase [Bacillus sp. cl95]
MIEKKRITVRGKDTYYLDYGNSDATAVILLHGFPESALLWGETVLAIQNAGYRAVAPDFPGFGQSEPFNEPSTWERYMDFLTDFVNELSIEQFHLVTHDWGALIGTRWACSHSEKVQSLIISDATFSPDFVWHKDALIIRTPGGGEQWLAYLTNKPVFEGFMKKSVPNVSSAIVEDFYELFSDANKSKITLELYRSGDMNKLEIYRGRLAEYLTMPVTIIFGENDSYIHPELGQKLKNEELYHASCHMIPEVGHFTPLEAPIEFNSLLIQHLKQSTETKELN